MSIENTFGSLFKPELKSSGRKLYAQEKLSVSGSDTSVQAYIRVSPPFKVTLNTEDIASHAFVAECNCPVAKKRRFCKHIWATLLAAEEKYPDFLIGKTELNKMEVATDAEPTQQAVYQEAAKQRASDYRKDQYQKQKARVKDKKREARGYATAQSSFSPEVEAALAYFALNGFPMPAGPDADILSEAKRTLARVFHPDKGGSHAEFVELNQNCEILQSLF